MALFDSLVVSWRRGGVFRGVLIEEWSAYPDAIIGHLAGGAGRIERPQLAPLVLADGDGYLIPPGTRYRFIQTTRAACTVRWSHVEARILGTVDAWSLLEVGMRLRDGERIGGCVERLIASDGIPAPLLRAVERQRLALELVSLVIAQARPLDAGTRLGALGRLAPALERMERALDEPLDRGGLARLVELSPTRFHAVFAEALGCAPMAYLQRLRLQRAQHLLIATELPIAAVAAAVGIPDQFHFSRLFRRRVGDSPTVYRRERRHALRSNEVSQSGVELQKVTKES